MICPSCKKEIHSVTVISLCEQTGTLEAGTNEILNYSSPKVLETEECYCPECNESVEVS